VISEKFLAPLLTSHISPFTFHCCAPWHVGCSKRPPMNQAVDLFGESEFRAAAPSFWERFLNTESVRELSDLEKLIAGCEIIAALDGSNLLLP
jgi:hypothetical protein